MKLLLLGATGRTGKQLLAQALDRGYEVTALVRSDSKIEAGKHPPRLRVRIGDVTEAAILESALDGQDAVISALGSNRLTELLGTDFITRSTRAIISAMQRRGVNRLVMLSALGVGETAALAPLLVRLVFRTVLRAVGEDKAAGEAHLQASNLDWTLVYPSQLTDGPLTGKYRSGQDLRVRGMAKISRADVAHFMLGEIGNTRYSRKAAILTH